MVASRRFQTAEMKFLSGGRRAWCAVLLACAALPCAGGGPLSGQEDQGRQEFAVAGCATCHGPAAKGAEAPALAGLSRPYPEFVKIVREGTGEMPAHSKDDVTDEQLTVIYKWLVQLSSKRAPIRGRRLG
jgi:mono/diheme cytochrome c family protein